MEGGREELKGYVPFCTFQQPSTVSLSMAGKHDLHASELGVGSEQSAHTPPATNLFLSVDIIFFA